MEIYYIAYEQMARMSQSYLQTWCYKVLITYMNFSPTQVRKN